MFYIPLRIFGENMKEMKIVGKRKILPSILESVRSFLRLTPKPQAEKPFRTKGVFRFKSFEDADEWMVQMKASRDQKKKSS